MAQPNTTIVESFDDFSLPVDPRLMEGIEQEFANFDHDTSTSFSDLPPLDGFPSSTDALAYNARDISYPEPDHHSSDVP